MELHGIISGQGHTQTFVQKVPERVFGIFQEKTVVAEWRHCNWHLCQVVQVLQDRTLRKVKIEKKLLEAENYKLEKRINCCFIFPFLL